jgi:hypothetical protein
MINEFAAPTAEDKRLYDTPAASLSAADLDASGRTKELSPEQCDAKSRHLKLLLRRRIPLKHAMRLATGYLIGIGLSTDTTFLAGRGDGLPGGRRGNAKAIRKARQQGVSGGFYSEQLGEWITSKEDVRRICEEKGHGCSGLVNVPIREPETDPHDKPYQVAEDVVQREVEEVVEREHDGKVDAKKRGKLTEAARERLAGQMNDRKGGRDNLLPE